MSNPKIPAGTVPWHPDKSYWPDANSKPVITVWTRQNCSDPVRWSVDLRYQPTDADPMRQHGVGFLARSQLFPERVVTLADWLANRDEHQP